MRMLASRLCALMRFVASDKARAVSEWLPMSFSTLFKSTGELGSSWMNQAMAKAVACQWGLFNFPVLVDLKMNSRARTRSSRYWPHLYQIARKSYAMLMKEAIFGFGIFLKVIP